MKKLERLNQWTIQWIIFNISWTVDLQANKLRFLKQFNAE